MAIKLFKYQYQPEGQQYPSVVYEWFEEGLEPSNFVSAETIPDIYYIDDSKGKDYNFRRAKLKLLVNQITGFDEANPATYTVENWDKLDPLGNDSESKVIASQFFLAPSFLRLLTVSQEQDEENWNALIGSSYLSRGQRLLKSKESVSYTLSKSESDQFFKDVQAFFQEFKEANTDDLVQWITNEVGSPYENDGYEQKSYYSLSDKDLLVDVLVNGKYLLK